MSAVVVVWYLVSVERKWWGIYIPRGSVLCCEGSFHVIKLIKSH